MKQIGKCRLVVAVLLTFALCVSCFVPRTFAESGLKTFSPEMAPTGSNEYWPYFNAWLETEQTVFQSFAVRFKATASFTGGMMALYVEGETASVSVQLYQWNQDYATSVAGEVRATATFNPVAPAGSGSRMEAMYTLSAAQNAGEYVAVFEVQNAAPFFPLKSKDLTNNVECYVAGEVVDVDFFGGIVFEDAAAGGFRPLVNERIPFASEKESTSSNADIFWDYFDATRTNLAFSDFAIRFKTTAPFTGGMVHLYVTNSIRIRASLYRWNRDYATSVAAAARTSAEFTVTGNNDRLEGNYAFDAAQPAGEYVVVFTVVSGDPNADVLIQLKTKDTTAMEECYMAGEEVPVDFFGGILFVNYDEGGFEAVEKIVQTVPFFDPNAESVPLEIADSFAIQFATGMPFDRIQISCPSWMDNIGSLRWTLYKWQNSYMESLGGEAIQTVDFIDIEDGHTEYFILQDEAEAGEYLLLIENITEETNQVGLWGVQGSSEHAHLYKDGAVYEGVSASMYIDVVGTDTDYYGALSDAVIGSQEPEPTNPPQPDQPDQPDQPEPPVTGEGVAWTAASLALFAAAAVCVVRKRRRGTV